MSATFEVDGDHTTTTMTNMEAGIVQQVFQPAVGVGSVLGQHEDVYYGILAGVIAVAAVRDSDGPLPHLLRRPTRRRRSPRIGSSEVLRAWTVGKRIRAQAAADGYALHRVLVSPFHRCLQTAAQAVAALCAVPDDAALAAVLDSSANVPLDTSRVKVYFLFFPPSLPPPSIVPWLILVGWPGRISSAPC
ncbi:hypothetical protein ZWY2020_031913 [Hordeum vulgare]|nr:hypothetical protein ZWY2020_031913 [Hordeum vulgare]